MQDVQVQILDDGPIVVKGGAQLLDAEGTKINAQNEVYLCRCGQSKNKPFCDGVHKGQFTSCVRAKSLM